jgi:hypothetical protein
MYVHIAGHGDAVRMAKAIHDGVALTKTPGPDAAPAAQPAAELGFDQKQVEQILGHTGKLTEEPRLFFMHFWANDDALKLAKGLRSALDLTNSGK